MKGITAIVLTLGLLSGGTQAMAAQVAPGVLSEVSVGEARGVQLPYDLTVIDGLGNERRLADWTQRERPVLLTLNYMGCPMLCGLQQSGLTAAIADAGLVPGVDFHMLSVSIDPSETAQMAQNATVRLSDGIGGQWDMVTAPPESLELLTETLTFNYVRDPVSGEFAHPAAVFVLSPGGVVSQVLGGLQPSARDLRLATVQAGEGRVGDVLDQLLLSCMQYDPTVQSYAPQGKRIMRAGGVIVLAGLGVFLTVLWWRDRKHSGGRRA
jgi:protein SCO1/2